LEGKIRDGQVIEVDYDLAHDALRFTPVGAEETASA
jgi:hypothetical protein